jgi:hypothetical protein
MADNKAGDFITIDDDADDKEYRNERNGRGRFEERAKFDARSENKGKFSIR